MGRIGFIGLWLWSSTFLIAGHVMAEKADALPDTSAKNCFMEMQKLEDRFYSELLAGSEKRNDVDAALKVLKEVGEFCPGSSEKEALLHDLKGEAMHLAYSYTGDKMYFDAGKVSYERGLALNTARNEKIYWHMARLLRTAKDYPKAVYYINQVLGMRPKPKDPLPYLQTAFQLTVDTEQWDDAGGLLEELSRRDKRFYRDTDLLLSAVKTLCHFKQLDDAKKSIQNVEQHVKLDANDEEHIRISRDVIKKCEGG
jgi:tetratricopeptide (TPR) repeat protein